MFFLNVFFLISDFKLVNGIVGGHQINIEDAPYQINYGDTCGGVLIQKKWALTAAHCGKLDFIRVGSKHRLKGDKANVVLHILHPKFSIKHEFDYDVQLLKIKEKNSWTQSIRSVCMGKIIDNNGTIFIAGWGFVREQGEFVDVLRSVRLKLVPKEDCQEIKQPWYNHTLTDTMFCAGGGGKKDACQGDSGGGALQEGLLVGIASFGYGCGRRIPGVFVNLTDPEIRIWIKKFTGV